jgi:hypothetical protein
MFNQDQIGKIKVFSTITKITNDCFIKCINFDSSINFKDNNNKKLSSEINFDEKICLEDCTKKYIALRDFIESQLFNDFESVNKKNKNILENET